MKLYKIEIVIDKICKEICYVVASDINDAKQLTKEHYGWNDIIFKSVSKVYGDLIIGDLCEEI